jgi:O-antigen ligase
MVALQRSRTTGSYGASEVASGSLALPVKLYLLAVVLPIGFHLGPLYMTVLRLVLILMFVPLLFQLLSGRIGRLYFVDYAYMFFCFWILVSFAVVHPERVLENGSAAVLEFLGGYLIARAYIRDRASFISLSKWLGATVAALLPLAVYESLTGRPIAIDFIGNIPGLTSYQVIYNEPRLGLDRAQTVFAHAIHFGLFCSSAFALTYVGLKNVIGNMQRLTLSVLIALGVFFSLSSGALLALLLQLFLIGWYLTLQRVKARWILLTGILVGGYIAVDILSNRTPIQVFLSYATFSAHNAYWRLLTFEWGLKNVFGDATEGIPANPWFGIGLGDWVRPSFMHTASMDNFWLVIAVRYGVPGLAALSAGYFWTLWKIGVRRDMDGDEQFLMLRRGWMFTFVGLTFTLSTVFVWTSLYSFIFFLFGAGIWMLAALPVSYGQEEASTCGQGLRYTRFPAAPAHSCTHHERV